MQSITDICFPDAKTVLDTTYGKGGFWNQETLTRFEVTGMDINPSRSPQVVADFTALPFQDQSFDLVVFDPPYMSDVGKKNPSIMGKQFGSALNSPSLQLMVMLGATESWRVARLGVIVKVQNHIHGGKLLHMTRWVEDAIPSPLYDEMHVQQRRKLIDPKWGEQRSLYRNHASYLVFRRGDQRHILRKRA